MTTAVILLLRRRFDDAVGMARKAMELAPGILRISSFAGYVLTATGNAGEAIPELEKAIRLNPHYPDPAMYLGFLGNAYRLAGRLDEAIATLEELSARAPHLGGRDLVLAYIQAGRPDAARSAAARLLASTPAFTVSGWAATQFRSDVVQMEADIAMLRTAGLPE